MADTIAQLHIEPGRAGGPDVTQSKLSKIEALTVAVAAAVGLHSTAVWRRERLTLTSHDSRSAVSRAVKYKRRTGEALQLYTTFTTINVQR